MKLLPLILSGLFASHLAAAPVVSVRGIVTGGAESIILDLVADITPGNALRSFGLAITYDSSNLTPTSLGRYDEIWFLSPDAGTTRLPYSEAAVLKPGLIEILGARFNSSSPMDGVSGQQVLLGTIHFDRNGNDPLKFELSLAKDEPFANFTLADGTPIDANLEGVGGALPIIIIEAPVDEDDDDLPDSYEIATFGSIKETTGAEDSDHDGDINYQEWLAGTDPNDASSRLRLIMTLQPDGSKVFEWSGQAGRIYNLTRSDTLQEFRPVSGPLSGIPAHQITEPGDNAPRAFYRLEVQNPTAR
ncbi:hypothetical protein V2O64_18810 [Verrucomicrobiaceae bacterium 227]